MNRRREAVGDLHCYFGQRSRFGEHTHVLPYLIVPFSFLVNLHFSPHVMAFSQLKTAASNLLVVGLFGAEQGGEKTFDKS